MVTELLLNPAATAASRLFSSSEHLGRTAGTFGYMEKDKKDLLQSHDLKI